MVTRRATRLSNDDALCSLTNFGFRPGRLLLSSATDAVIRVGRLDGLRLQPDFYVYAGSALGPGGVRAHLAHHMRLASAPIGTSTTSVHT